MRTVQTPDGPHAVPDNEPGPLMACIEVFGLVRPGDIFEIPLDKLPAVLADLQRRDADFYEVLAPKPQPGDVVTVLGDYYHVRGKADDDRGRRAVIDGSHYGMDLDDGRGPVVLAVFGASAFRGPSITRTNPADNGPEYVSCSGGPCPFIPLADLQPAGTTDAHFWRWADMPRAGGGVDYVRTVAHWTATLNERNA